MQLQKNPMAPGLDLVRSCTRKPQRLTITVSWQLYQILLKQSDLQGRSLSNLACFWLESQAEVVCKEINQKA
jgi:hypothetical protein